MTELVHLLTDWPHWAFEAISGLAYGLLGALVARPLLRRHDEAVHGVDKRQRARQRLLAASADRDAKRWWAV